MACVNIQDSWDAVCEIPEFFLSRPLSLPQTSLETSRSQDRQISRAGQNTISAD